MANTQELDRVVVKFAGDSGDGMQLTGTQFTDTSALLGNDVATFPDYPAEIRAPQGTVAGVSGFQVHFGKRKVYTSGDLADVVVAMNPAALKANLVSIKRGGTFIVDTDSFGKKDLEKAGYETNPLEDGSLEEFQVIEAPITTLTKTALKDSGLDGKSVLRCKNMFSLGVVYWLYNRPSELTINFLNKKFQKRPELAEANIKVLNAGIHYAETIEAFNTSYTISAAKLEKGTYRNIMGNTATAWGFLAAAEKSGRDLFLGSYPITPASDILHELSKYKNLGVKTFQAEDEIGGVCTAIGASFAGDLAITTTSGPGLALKAEGIGLAVMTELPLVVVDVQRGGPSTGLPTKTEQADLLQALYGRNGESPVIVIAASTPSNCFYYAYMASKLALEHMTPVILLSDGYLGNGSEPWKIQTTKDLPDITPPLVKAGQEYQPYARDLEKLSRKWAIPGTPGLEHRLGGLEKQDVTGNVSYDPKNHEKMVKLREEKVARVANFIPEQEVLFNQKGDLLVIGWGGTQGHLYNSTEQLVLEGNKIGLVHINYLNPLPKNLTNIFGKFKKIVVCELNRGQLVKHLRGVLPQFQYEQYNKIQGLPFRSDELIEEFSNLLKK